jgi:TolB-like protein
MACAWFIPTVERVRLANYENHIVVLPFDIAENNRAEAILVDGLMDAIAGKLSNLDQEQTLWVVPPSEIRRRKVNDPETALREFGATVVVKGHFSWDRGVARLNLELIDSKRMREIGYADIENREQDLSELQNEAVIRLSRLMNGNPVCTTKSVKPLP